MDAELAAKLFKDMPIDCQLQYLAQFGFQVPNVQTAVQTKLIQDGKLLPPPEQITENTEIIN